MRKSLKISATIAGLFSIATIAFLVWAYSPVPAFEPLDYEPRKNDYWPTDGWQYSTPEQQGMNSERLLEMMAFYQQSRADNKQLYIDSMTIVRNGYIVAELYNNPLYPRDEKHVIHSATKSIVSALIGVAIDKGYIRDVDVQLLDIFPNRQIRNLSDRKREITIRDLLSMETGLHTQDSFLYAYEGLFALQHSEDWVGFALDLPMAAAPGERFDYSNISTFLLSAIIAESTGADPLEFAKEHLFGPLGITDIQWEWNSEGLPIAWARMWLKPNDMAKIGLLFLQQGKWNDRQVISASWVRDSLTPWAYPKNAVDILNVDMSKNREMSTRNWVAQRFIRPFTDGYGFQWWLDKKGNYSAMGTSGQYIIVAPQENLVFVVTSKSAGVAQFTPAALFYDYVLTAIESGEALPQNEAAYHELGLLATPPEFTKETATAADLPTIATNISGKTYSMESNPYNTNNIRFVFDQEKGHAQISYTAREDWNVEYLIGLDNAHRFTETNGSTFVAIGEWTAPNVFSVEVEIIGYSTFDKWQFTFKENEIQVEEISITGNYVYTGAAN